MNKQRLFFLLLITSICFTGCNNLFHDLIPSSSSDIMNFSVRAASTGVDVTLSSEISEKSVLLTVPDGTDVSNLIPVITTDSQSTVLPITIPYLHEAFPSANLMTLALNMNTTLEEQNTGSWVFDFIRENPDFTVPSLSTPIDFTSSVMFCVISGLGQTTLYTVTVMTKTNSDDKKEEDASTSEKNILSFVTSDEVGDSVIGEDTVSFAINSSGNIAEQYPVITVSSGASILPLTMEYLVKVMTYDQMLAFYTGYSTATNTDLYTSRFLKNIGSYTIPALTLPIDFSSPVLFAVIGSDGGVKIYTISGSVDSSSPELNSVSFTKFNNPSIMGDAAATKVSSTVYTANVLYPVEYDGTYELIPDISYVGTSVKYSVDGGTTCYDLTSATTPIPFTKTTRSCTLYIYRNSNILTVTLTVTYGEDPDTIRSITDFRFTKSLNSGIKSTTLASIHNDGDTGLITATVLYEGSTAPYELIPSFVTPGTVTVSNASQSSGVTKQNFSTDLLYTCTSKDGLYSRVYTVRISFEQVAPAQAVITSFTFPTSLNSDLTSDCTATIDESSATITASVLYSSGSAPYSLVPEFAASGTVSVSGVSQSSGYTSQNFKTTVYYKVTSADDSSITKTYAVHVSYTQDSASSCKITSFSFESSANSTLTSDVHATISQDNGKITALLPRGANSSSVKLVPTFTAEGTVKVDNVIQTSGKTANSFASTVYYVVTSSNGLFSKTYAVTITESGALIYVNSRATGSNNGSSWGNAYTTLSAALTQISSLSSDAASEIWIANSGDTYVPSTNGKFIVKGNTTIRGGFTGTETSESERTAAARSEVQMDITGTNLSGFVVFDSIKKTSSTLATTSLSWSSNATSSCTFSNCSFDYTKISTNTALETLTIADSEMTNSSSDSFCAGTISITNSTIKSNDCIVVLPLTSADITKSSTLSAVKLPCAAVDKPSITIADSHFTGTVTVQNAACTLTDSFFESSNASVYASSGSELCSDGCTFTINDCTDSTLFTVSIINGTSAEFLNSSITAASSSSATASPSLLYANTVGTLHVEKCTLGGNSSSAILTQNVTTLDVCKNTFSIIKDGYFVNMKRYGISSVTTDITDNTFVSYGNLYLNYSGTCSYHGNTVTTNGYQSETGEIKAVSLSLYGYDSGVATITDSEFLRLYTSYGTVNASGCTIHGRTYNSALSLNSSEMTGFFTDCTICACDETTAHTSGVVCNGIYSMTPNLKMKDCTVSGFTTAIRCDSVSADESTFVLDSCSFSNCYNTVISSAATFIAGVLQKTNSTTYPLITGCTFAASDPDTVGHNQKFMFSVIAKFTECTFSGNPGNLSETFSVLSGVGGVFNHNTWNFSDIDQRRLIDVLDANIEVTNETINFKTYWNFAMYTSTNNDDGYSATFTGCTFNNSTVYAIYSQYYTLTIKSSTFTNDEKGVEALNSYVTVSDTIFESCGYGILSECSQNGSGVSGCHFTNCGRGFQGNVSSITNCGFTSCGNNGIFLYSTTDISSTSITKCTFDNCSSSTSRGGGVCVKVSQSGTTTTISGNTFTNCQCKVTTLSLSGGGAISISILADNTSVIIKNNFFSSNSNLASSSQGNDVFVCAKWNNPDRSYSGATLDYADNVTTDTNSLFTSGIN